jgi:hypothetical protein
MMEFLLSDHMEWILYLGTTFLISFFGGYWIGNMQKHVEQAIEDDELFELDDENQAKVNKAIEDLRENLP